jgi:hypothetical protein
MAHQNEDPKNLLILAVGLGSMVVLAATMYGLGSYYRMLRDDEQFAKILGRNDPYLTELHAEEKRKLEGPAVILDASKKRVRIPIARAMTLLAQRGRDGVPSIRVDPATAPLAGPDAAPAASAASSAPAPSDSAAPAGSGSAAPAGSAAVPAEDHGKDKDKDKDKKKDKDKQKDKDKGSH